MSQVKRHCRASPYANRRAYVRAEHDGDRRTDPRHRASCPSGAARGRGLSLASEVLPRLLLASPGMHAIRYQSPDPALVLPFAARGGAGSVHVHYGVTEDPAAVGFDLAAVGFDAEKFRGFPAMRAEASFNQTGYRAMFGWIQLVTTTHAGHADATTVSVDLAPMLASDDCPLAFFGHLPTLFDAPANPGHPDGQWVAESFLVAVPDIARSRRLAALTGFRWGYQLTAGCRRGRGRG